MNDVVGGHGLREPTTGHRDCTMSSTAATHRMAQGVAVSISRCSIFGMLRNYCQQGRRTAELAGLLVSTQTSTRESNDQPLPQQHGLHRSDVKLIIEDYEAGASTYELAVRYNVRRNTIRDTLRRAGWDVSDRATRAALTEEQKTEARAAFETGATRRQLMARYGVSESTIRRALKRS